METFDTPPPTTPPTTPPTKRGSWINRLLRFEWQPTPLEPPQSDPELPSLTALERAAEAFRYGALRTEYWLSPKGALREWARLNLSIATHLAIPALIIIPIVTFMLGQFNTWLGLLVKISTNLVVFPLTAILAICLISGMLVLIRTLFGR